jgi:hypothetical protein
MHAIRAEDEEAPLDPAHYILQIGKLWKIRRWSELELVNAKPLLQIWKEDAHLIEHEWSEARQTKQKSLVERYTLRGASGPLRVH